MQLTQDRLNALAQWFESPLSVAAESEAARADVARALGAVLERCRTAWPALRVDIDGFVRHLASKSLGENPAEALQKRFVEDLFLAFACAAGSEPALAAFAATYRQDVDIACAKANGAPPAAEVLQQLAHKLFVAAPPAVPGILDYSGQGTLRGWFRVVTSRLILDNLRGAARAGHPVAEDAVLGVPSPNDDPETAYLKTRYRHEFRESFEQAVAGLQPEERNVLRAYYGKGLSIDELAGMFGIHRATAARRVHRARDLLMAETRRHLTSRLKLSGTELESVLRLIQSNLHVSVGRLME